MDKAITQNSSLRKILSVFGKDPLLDHLWSVPKRHTRGNI